MKLRLTEDAGARLSSPPPPDGANRTLLMGALELAVTVRLAKMEEPDWEVILPRRDELAALLGENGGKLQFGSVLRGEVTQAFEAFAEAVAYLSCLPEGVLLFGYRWEATP